MCVAKKYLQQVELADKHINNLLEEKARLEDLSLRITTNLSSEGGGFGGGYGDKVGTAAGKIVDLEREINASIDRYVDLKRQVKEVIEQVKDPDQVELLYKRYFQFEKWEQIACEMHMEYRSVTRVHDRALQSVREILKICP